MSRIWTTWDCSEPCPVWPRSGFSVQRGWGKPFQREESILPCCQTLGCHGWGLHPARVEQNLIWSTNGAENHSQSWKKEETKWILGTRNKTCIYSYFLPRNGWKSKTEAVVSHFSMSWTATFPVTATPWSGPSWRPSVSQNHGLQGLRSHPVTPWGTQVPVQPHRVGQGRGHGDLWLWLGCDAQPCTGIAAVLSAIVAGVRDLISSLRGHCVSKSQLF